MDFEFESMPLPEGRGTELMQVLDGRVVFMPSEQWRAWGIWVEKAEKEMGAVQEKAKR